MAENKNVFELQIYKQDEILTQKEREAKALASKVVNKNKRIKGLKDHVNQINTSLHNYLNRKKINHLIKSKREDEDIEADRKKFYKHRADFYWYVCQIGS